MKGIGVVVAKEWKCFTGSDHGMLILYFVLVMIWSTLIATRTSEQFDSGPLWLVFFSVVITANFSNSIFISERVSGALEILITSGLSRNAILYGKLLFILGISILFGALCIGLSILLGTFVFLNETSTVDFSAFLLYTASAFLNVSSSAYFSVRLSNHRLLHFMNMFLLGCIVGAFMIVSGFFYISIFYLIAVLTGISAVFCWGAQKLFHSEKIIQPVNV